MARRPGEQRRLGSVHSRSGGGQQNHRRQWLHRGICHRTSSPGWPLSSHTLSIHWRQTGSERRQADRSLALQSRRRRPLLVRQGHGHLLRDLAVLQPMDRLATPLWSHIPPVSDTNPQFIECQKVEHHPLTFNILQNPALQIHRAVFTNIFIHNQLAITAKICKCNPKRLTLQ